MIITQSGLVGINIIPTIYFFEVGGTIKVATVRSAGNIYAEAGSVIARNTVEAATSVAAGTNVTAGTRITAENTITSTSGRHRCRQW